MIMFGASLIFVFLSIFYYDYVPEDAFVIEQEEEMENKSQNGSTKNQAFEGDGDGDDEKNGKTLQTADL